MEIQKYLMQKKELQKNILKFIENENESEDDFINLLKITDLQQIMENKNELFIFLRLLTKVGENHHRNSKFFNNIEKIILHIGQNIKQTFSNIEIYDIFKRNKSFLLFLINQDILAIDSCIYNELIYNSKSDSYCHFFLPELKPYFKEKKYKIIENQLCEDDSEIFTNFDEKRQIGENDSYICDLIRKDSIEEFVSFVNRANYRLSSQIKTSIFETNLFLLKHKETTLIEYAAFFGSIQIIQYLKLNNVELKPSLWLYAIHSKNAEIIHFLEENHVEPSDSLFKECIKESIKCHHTEITEYIITNFIDENNYNENIFNYSFRYYNYMFFPNEFDNQSVIFNLCEYNYVELVKFFLENENSNSYLNKKMVKQLTLLIRKFKSELFYGIQIYNFKQYFKMFYFKQDYNCILYK